MAVFANHLEIQEQVLVVVMSGEWQRVSAAAPAL